MPSTPIYGCIHATFADHPGGITFHRDIQRVGIDTVVIQYTRGDLTQIILPWLPMPGHMDQDAVLGQDLAQSHGVFGNHGLVHRLIKVGYLLFVGHSLASGNEFFNLFSGRAYFGALDGQAVLDGGGRNGRLQVTETAAKAVALVGGERNHGLSAPVMGLQESGDAHRVSAPPAGPSQVDGVVLRDIDIGLERRAGLGIQLFLGLLRAFIIVDGIFLDGLQAEDIGLRELLNLLGDDLGVALFQIDNAVGSIVLKSISY